MSSAPFWGYKENAINDIYERARRDALVRFCVNCSKGGLQADAETCAYLRGRFKTQTFYPNVSDMALAVTIPMDEIVSIDLRPMDDFPPEDIAHTDGIDEDGKSNFTKERVPITHDAVWIFLVPKAIEAGPRLGLLDASDIIEMSKDRKITIRPADDGAYEGTSRKYTL